MKFNPYLNHRWFGSPGLLDSSEATHLNLLPLPAPRFDSLCFLLLIRPHLKLFAPFKNKSVPICSFLYLNTVIFLLLTFLSISLTSGCLFPHRCKKRRSRRALRVPWRMRISKWEGRLNPSPITLQPTPQCKAETLWRLGMIAWAGEVYKSAPQELGTEATP